MENKRQRFAALLGSSETIEKPLKLDSLVNMPTLELVLENIGYRIMINGQRLQGGDRM